MQTEISGETSGNKCIAMSSLIPPPKEITCDGIYTLLFDKMQRKTDGESVFYNKHKEKGKLDFP